MKEENSIKVLDELNKGCLMGIDAIELVLDKVSGKDFRKILERQKKFYEDMSDKVLKLYSKFCDEDPVDISTMDKVMTWYGIQMNTITDSSTSKLAELLIKGTNMGIIEGKKMLNHKEMDKKVEILVNEYVKMQEDCVESLKKCL